MTRPLVAVIADRKPMSAGAWLEVPTDGLPHSYLHALEMAGAAPVLIPSMQSHLDEPGRVLDMVDGLFLAGGRDLDASTYGQEPHALNDPSLVERDALEIALVLEARLRGMPVFGACRGMQVINVAFGGDLEQHLGDRVDLTPHRHTVGSFSAHAVNVVPGTALDEILGRGEVSIASHHHQGVGVLAVGLRASGYAEDGVVEAFEAADGSFCLGVQWHPEDQLSGDGEALFGSFVSSAEDFAQSKARVGEGRS